MSRRERCFVKMLRVVGTEVRRQSVRAEVWQKQSHGTAELFTKRLICRSLHDFIALMVRGGASFVQMYEYSHYLK